MTKIGLLMIGCAGISTISGCMADSPAADLDQTRVTESTLTNPGAGHNATGAFRHLQLRETNYCLQPQNGWADSVSLELAPCTSSQAQNWHFSWTPNGTMIVNQLSGLCVYNSAPLPLY